jgi:murein DD-endopeptidase MepM/ murein hydrolase activator NlpD
VLALVVLGFMVACSSAPAAAAGLAGARSAESSASGWRWPAALPVTVVGEFVAPPTRYSPGHRGTDLLAHPGDIVFAAHDGVVVFAGTVGDRPLIAIDHAGDYRSSTEPVVASVAAGDTVARGQPIGTMAAGGHCGGACLHFGVRLHDEYINPRALIGGIPHAVLLPIARASAVVRAVEPSPRATGALLPRVVADGRRGGSWRRRPPHTARVGEVRPVDGLRGRRPAGVPP